MNSRIRSFAEPYTGLEGWKDPNVKRLVQAWIGRAPSDLNVTFEEFLLIPYYKVQTYGTEFAKKHHELIRKILVKYADSLNTINEMTESEDTRVPLERVRHEAEDKDEDRLYAQDFDEAVPNLASGAGEAVIANGPDEDRLYARDFDEEALTLLSGNAVIVTGPDEESAFALGDEQDYSYLWNH